MKFLPLLTRSRSTGSRFYLLYFLFGLCIGAGISSVLGSVADETLLDDEDNPHYDTIEFLLTIHTELRCDHWQTVTVVDQPVKSNIHNALVTVVRQDCQCDFNSQHLVSNEITCSTQAGDTMFYSGEIRQGLLSSKYDVLHSIKQWVGKQPVLTLTVQLFTKVNINITILDISSVHVAGSGNGGFSSGDEPEGSGNVVSEGTTTINIEPVTTEQNQISEVSPNSFGMVCTPSAISLLLIVLVNCLWKTF